MAKNQIHISITLSANSFKNFAIFDTMKRKKSWKFPVTAAAVLILCAILLFSFQEQNPNAYIPGCIFIAVGAGIGMSYFKNFNKSLQEQIEKMKLDPPRHVYTIDLNDAPDGIRYFHPKEKEPAGIYSWNSVHGAWRTKSAVYLYVTPQQALIFPISTKGINLDEIWKFITGHLDASRIHTVK